jgi:hypothetical protein
MSYLDRPRLTFFGRFTANPSTINNTPSNYNMAKPLGDLAWNPEGRHNFSLDDCVVTGVVFDGDAGDTAGSLTTTQNGVLVDLDTDQQGVSQIIGMKLAVTVGGGSVTGTFQPTNFTDMFIRPNTPVIGDGRFSAIYQSVLTDLQWNAKNSPFLMALKAVSPTQLSIKFTVDAYHDHAWVAGDFTHGRVAGTIGPQFPGEPTTFVNARLLRPTSAKSQFGSFNYAPAKTDLQRKTITFDLGNAVPTYWPNTQSWPVSQPMPLQAALIPAKGDPIPFGWIDTSEAAYEKNVFVQEIALPDDVAALIATTPTGILSPNDATRKTPPPVVLQENPTGAYLNFDEYVWRLNPGDPATIHITANLFEKPAANATISLSLGGFGPGTGKPTKAVQITPKSVPLDANGTGSFQLSTTDPGNPRGFIDGQVYAVNYTWSADANPDGNTMVSVHLFQQVDVPPQPTWWQDVYPILSQYARLYPAMDAIIQLDSYDEITKKIKAVVARLNLPEDDPGYMPITRELSASKTAIILTWAKNGTPLGTPPTAKMKAKAAAKKKK